MTGTPGIFQAGDGGASVFDNVVGDNVRLVGMAWGQTEASNFIFSAMLETRSDNPARPGHPWRTFPPPPAP